MKNIIYLVLIFSFCSLNASAQEQAFLDSLENLLPSLSGKNKATMLGELCFQYSLSDIPKSTRFGLLAVKEAEQTNDSLLLSQCWNDLSIPYLYKGDYDSCILLNNLALKYRQNIGDSILVGKSLSKLANAHYERGNMSRALELNLRAIDIFRDAGQLHMVARMLNNVGNIYDRNGNYDKALAFFEEAIESAENVGGKLDFITASGNVANTLQKVGRLKEAERLFLELIPLIEETGKKEYLAVAFQGLGSNMRKRERPAEGLQYYKKSLEIYQEIGSEMSISLVEVNLGYCHMELGEYDQAEVYFKSGLELAQKIKSDFHLKHAFLGLAHMENRKGNFEKAGDYFEDFVEYQKSIYNEESSANISEMQVKYDTERKEKELAQEQLENTQNKLAIRNGNLRTVVVGGIASLLLLIAFFAIRTQRKKREQELQEFKLKTALQQAESKQVIIGEKLRISRELHDNIGSRLTYIISSLDIELHKSKGSEEMTGVSRFAKETMGQLRETIWAVSDKTIFFSELKLRIEQYLRQTAPMTRMELTFLDRSTADFELNSTQTINIFRIVQEAISNAMKYSLAEKTSVEIEEGEGLISVTIADNGTGFNTDQSANGTGILGMRERAQEISATFFCKSTLGKGTEVNVSFPVGD